MEKLARRVVFRLIALPLIAAIVAFAGGIHASILGAAAAAFVGTVLYTAIDELIYRRVLYGKVGNEPFVWWFVHLIYQTVFAALFTYVTFYAFGWHVGTTWLAGLGVIVSWVWLTRETLVNLLALLLLKLTLRR